MKIKKQLFGTTSQNQKVYRYTMTNSINAKVSILSYGAIIQSIELPDKNGHFDDIVLGCDSIEDYQRQPYYFGAVVGRCCGRIPNGRISFQGRTFSLDQNEGVHHLHGGFCGFSKRIWDIQPEENSIICRLHDVDGRNGYPGNVDVSVRYQWDDSNRLGIYYTATTDLTTPINLTNHSYFNLNGHNSGSILDHTLQIHASSFLELDQNKLFTGNQIDTRSTPMDFTLPVQIGQRLPSSDPQIQSFGGYDHLFVLDRSELYAAIVYSPSSGRILKVRTDQPGVLFYTANGDMTNVPGKSNAVYRAHSALCLETQSFPSSSCHDPFAPILLNPGKVYYKHTIFDFDVI